MNGAASELAASAKATTVAKCVAKDVLYFNAYRRDPAVVVSVDTERNPSLIAPSLGLELCRDTVQLWPFISSRNNFHSSMQ